MMQPQIQSDRCISCSTLGTHRYLMECHSIAKAASTSRASIAALFTTVLTQKLAASFFMLLPFRHRLTHDSGTSLRKKWSVGAPAAALDNRVMIRVNLMTFKSAPKDMLSDESTLSVRSCCRDPGTAHQSKMLYTFTVAGVVDSAVDAAVEDTSANTK